MAQSKTEHPNDIVISGLSGRYPISNTVNDFVSNLLNKVNMVNDDESRFKHNHPQIPRFAGKLPDIENFDREFFGLTQDQTDLSDVQARFGLEESFKCVMDAGVNPFSLRGTNTAVYFGASTSEHAYYTTHHKKRNPYGFTGSAKACWPTRISNFLGLEGPSMVVDTACSSSIYATYLAVKALEEGLVDSAIVLGANLCSNPSVTLQFALLGVLSPDGFCRPFDKDANGYCRSEAVVAMFLQRRKNAKRIYATVISSKVNCDGFKVEGITFPSRKIQERLLREIYTPETLNIEELGFIEAHATATNVGDPEECRAIDRAICSRRKDPLYLGSVKANCGHSEPSAGLISLSKVIMALNMSIIPPNINFKNKKENIEGLVAGRLVVVSNPTKWPANKPYAGVNSFGFGGANAHVILKQHSQPKKQSTYNDCPRLVVWAGRKEHVVDTFFTQLEKMPLDDEFIVLAHSSQSGGIKGMSYRGYSVLQPQKNKAHPVILKKSIKAMKDINDPIVWIFSGAGSHWTDISKSLMKLPLFKQSIQKCHNTLKPSGLDLVQILTSDDASISNNLLYSFVCVAAIQIALVDLLKAFEIQGDFLIGHGVGELGCAYADGSLTSEQMILAAYYRGKVGMEFNNMKDAMAPKLLNYLQYIIPKAQLRSGKWLSTVTNKRQWFTESYRYASSEYFAKALLDTSLFEETLKIVPRHAITLQIGPHKLIQSTLNKQMPLSKHIDLINTAENDALVSLLSAMGSIYSAGVELNLEQLYPDIKFPVSRGTENLSSHVLLDHSIKNFVFKYNALDGTHGRTTFGIKLEDDFLYLRGHEIDGRVLVPATFYLECVWKALVNIRGGHFENLPVHFEDVKFERATTLPSNTTIHLDVVVHTGTGAFEVTEAGSLVVTGFVQAITDATQPAAIVSDKYDLPALENKHFYKELKLRGYHYHEDFQSVDSAYSDGDLGKIKWIDNWVTFMDCMLQLSIIQHDSRTLALPTKIRNLKIYPQYHKQYVAKEPLCKIIYNKLERRTLGGGIEIIGLEASSVNRRRAPGDPVLEHYTFIPHFPAPKLNMQDVARCCIQLALENQPKMRLEIVQLTAGNGDYELLQHLVQAVGDLPLTTANINIIHNTQKEEAEIDIPGIINVFPEDECNISNSYIVVTNTAAMKNLPEREAYILSNMDANGFIILRDKANISISQLPKVEGYVCIGVFPSEKETTVILKGESGLIDIEKSKILRISGSDNSFKWLDEMKKIVEIKEDIIVLSEDDKLSGVVGLVNCLTKEPDTKHVRCLFVSAQDKVPFKINSIETRKQLQLGLTINIYKNGKWGTLRHLSLSCVPVPKPRNDHVYGNIRQIGDLSTLTWMDGPIAEKNQKVRVIFSSLNFKDVMQASGRLPIAELGVNRLNQTCIFGFEYSGVNIADGKRVMGMTYQGAVSSHIEKITQLQWNIPDNWSLQEAATVPVVYLTVYYAFFYTADVRKGKTILIHAGSGGIGIAAIRTAQAYGLEVYTTVSTPDKKAYLMKTFPTLNESNIGNSRDTSFEDLIMTRTQGNGVDFVLNSLSEDKLKASIRCLAKGGHFMEIGKFDMAKDNDLNLGPFQNALTFHTILADNLLNASVEYVEKIKQHIYNDMKRGIIQPLPTTVFKGHEIEQAFRFLMSGKHIGKVLLQVRENENSKETLPITVLPQTYFKPNLVYIVPGGLGGFGLELVDWMIVRGARKIVLSSSRGVSNDYQKYKIGNWKNNNCQIEVDTSNIGTEKGCLELLEHAMKLGDVGGIFNLAVVLRDSIFPNQNKELYQQSFAPKAYATKYLDQLSRKLCAKLEHFVIFSSVSCGRGNAGQTNYGMANSIMERIIEDRVSVGLPGKAIQWGAVGEVGLVAEMAAGKIDLEIGGTLQQRISSCLEVLDELFNCPHPIVASMVVAEKRAQSSGQSPLEFVLNAMSIRDVKSISLNSTLTELGMDSLLSVEIKQTFERDYDIVLNTADLRSLTFAQLAEMSVNKSDTTANTDKQQNNVSDEDTIAAIAENLAHFYGDLPPTTDPSPIVKLNDIQSADLVIFLPGIVGCVDESWYTIGRSTKFPAYMIQNHSVIAGKIWNYVDLAVQSIIGLLEEHKSKNFKLVGYSMGALITHHVISALEEKGYTGRAMLIDGSPFYLRDTVLSLNLKTNDLEMDKLIISVILTMALPKLKLQTIHRDLRNNYTEEEWFNYCRENLRKFEHPQPDQLTTIMQSIFQKVKILQTAHTFENISIINTKILLIKPTEKFLNSMDETYGLSPFSKNIVETDTIEGNHSTILKNPKLINIINNYFSK